MIGETSVTKKCEICGETKPIEEFSKSYRNRCKKCVAEHAREMRELRKIANTGVFGFEFETISISKQLAIKTIEESARVITNELDFVFMNFPKRAEIIGAIVNDYRKEITEWLNDKTKEL